MTRSSGNTRRPQRFLGRRPAVSAHRHRERPQLGEGRHQRPIREVHWDEGTDCATVASTNDNLFSSLCSAHESLRRNHRDQRSTPSRANSPNISGRAGWRKQVAAGMGNLAGWGASAALVGALLGGIVGQRSWRCHPRWTDVWRRTLARLESCEAHWRVSQGR